MDTESARTFVTDRLEQLGTREAFRVYDARDVDADRFDLPNGTVEPDTYKIEVPFEDEEQFFEDLHWRTSRLVGQLGQAIGATTSSGINTVSQLSTAYSAIDSQDPVLVLSSALSGRIGSIPHATTVTMDPQTQLSEDILVADREHFGFEVVSEDVHVLEYEGEEQGSRIVQISFEYGYTVQDPDAARWVDIS